MADNKSDATYVLGRSEAEERRLERKSQFQYPFTRGFFEDTGLSSGMNVLDIGSGAGDVSLLAADIVGQDARVTGVDMNAEILYTARERARASGHQNVNFVAGDIRELSFDEQFDAVIGRLVLIYLKDAGAVLRHAVSFLRPGGLVAFQEIDFSSLLTLRTVPLSPLGDRAVRWVYQAFQQAGAEVDMGFKIPGVFREAGLPDPQIYGQVLMGAGPNWNGYEYLATTIRSLMPYIEKFAIATPEEVG
ncbi:MAG: class I SAM-dependent methyltransferase [candidate division Zixibacteria bacterium]|nr:class I SAM-dependent methyltransferase [candidate division Zixibacteria bacterium]